MKTNLSSGDLIEWIYTYDNVPVFVHEMLWSSSMEKRVPIGPQHTQVLLFMNDEVILWMHETKGFIHARVDDTILTRPKSVTAAVHPRARG